jgi:hypothetical protein
MKIKVVFPDERSEDIYVREIGRDRENRGGEGSLFSQSGPAQGNAGQGMRQVLHAWSYMPIKVKSAE